MDATATESDDSAAWADAAAFMVAHGEAWPYEALAYMKTLHRAHDVAGCKRWLNIRKKMSDLTTSPRQ